MAEESGGRTEVATLGGGCFWCVEATFEQLQGVERVVSGYAGGHVPDPTYEQVCTGTTGHAEVVQIHFDPRQIGFEDLLRVFFTVHDPTTVDRQGGDVGPQYRSVVIHHTPEQKAAAEAVIREVEASGMWDAPVVTELAPFERFYSAEGYHQEYFRNNPQQPYCTVVVGPKVAKFRKAFAHRLKPAFQPAS
jgi:peptide-methionine (S)-S-oxide reductase